MTVSEQDLHFITITDEMNTFVEYTAKKRKLFEYPRQGYGDYDSRGISKIKIGILGELAFLEYIFNFLEGKTVNLLAKDRWKILHKRVGFAYNIIIGKFDEGFEFRIGDKTIDIKTYENNVVTVEQIFNGLKNNRKPLNLFIDKTQSTRADYYVQTFIMNDNRVCLSGYNEGLPPLAHWMPNPAYTRPVTELQPIKEILNLINFNGD